MPDEVVHVVEDAFHRLQHPEPDKPETDDDLTNAAQVAIWNCEPSLRGRIHALARDGQLTLTGVLENEQQRTAIVAAVLGLNGVDGVTNWIGIIVAPRPGDEESRSSTARYRVSAQPMLYVTRYCGIEPYSLTAALHEAMDVLDRRFRQLGRSVPDDVVVVYRNRLPESVVLDVGYIVPESAQAEIDDDIKLGRTPEGTMLAARAEFGSRHLFETHDQLVQQANLADLTPLNFAWQRFPRKAALLRIDHPAASLYLPVS
jgi:hypothetical protein